MTRNSADDLSNGHLDLAIPPPGLAHGNGATIIVDPLASLAGTLMDVNDQYRPQDPPPSTASQQGRAQPHTPASLAEQAAKAPPRDLLDSVRARVRAEPRSAIAAAAITGALVWAALRMR